ncbi:amino acid adenylation domain-containing protein [Streptomyces sp. YIM S03343]
MPTATPHSDPSHEGRPPHKDAPFHRIEEAFAQQAAEHPDAVAVVDGERSVTYGELWDTAGRLAAGLADAGVAPGGLVGLKVHRGWRVVAGILGIWRHGSGYVPLDPRYPQTRQDYIAGDAGLRHLLVEDLEDGLRVKADQAAGARAVPVPEDTAYIIHTSGSTGDPKGVVVRHSHVLALLESCGKTYDVGADDVWSFFHSHSFDFSVWEIWGALLSGGRVVVVPHEAATDSKIFAGFLAEHGVTVLSQVPSVFGYLVRALADHPVPLPQLRYVVFGGEAVHPQSLLRWYRLGVAPRAELYNMYGITEITVHATVAKLSPALLRAPGVGTPIGEPLPHLTMVLLEGGRPVPPGVPGEIHLAGEGVADGYLGRPELTAQRFVRIEELGADRVWYRSGDYAIERLDGGYEFLGRRDDQVKIRGFRIELGEIESVIAGQAGIRECAVVVAESLKGEPTLAAGFVPENDDPAQCAATAAQLRSRLPELLPRHMVPGQFVPVNKLPLTLSGKLDRAALARRIQEDDH